MGLNKNSNLTNEISDPLDRKFCGKIFVDTKIGDFFPINIKSSKRFIKDFCSFDRFQKLRSYYIIKCLMN